MGHYKISKLVTNRRSLKMESSLLGDVLMKIGMFVLVQALVYLILSKSSTIFSNGNNRRSHSFKSATPVSIRRILAALQDMPPEPSPSPRDYLQSATNIHQDNSPADNDQKLS
ncbi:hypothetical protein CFOL_v3_21075 [Cephalotus follicularis]|uniref:Uncharacterized protein n=1 Tax=Cephalotus follicularis TaxID=3775 RepID=A0A1Q3CBJ1_CEPFO|nr:hypothetical protein CFOL_v3_21075 [Cephalotus follicularis]